MMVRLTGFQRLSPDLPATMPDAVRDEILAAFGDQGVVGVSTASAPAARARTGLRARRDHPARRQPDPCHHPPYQRAIRRDLVVEQFQLRGRRRVACAAPHRGGRRQYGSLRPVRGLDLCEGAARRGPRRLYAILPELRSLSDEPGKGLQAARSVAAAAPDFSWGWSGVVLAAAQNLMRPISASGARKFGTSGSRPRIRRCAGPEE